MSLACPRTDPLSFSLLHHRNSTLIHTTVNGGEKESESLKDIVMLFAAQLRGTLLNGALHLSQKFE
jgi:hypothetical protein